jgi:hypothetical protein
VQHRRCDCLVLGTTVSAASLYLVGNLRQVSTSATRSIRPRVVFPFLPLVACAASGPSVEIFARLEPRWCDPVGKEPRRRGF